jgi:hypothetical protein
MKKIVSLSLLGFVLSGCAADTTRTLPILVWEDRPLNEIIYRERAPLVVPPDYRNPNIRQPREDSVIRDYEKNNFAGNIRTAPLPQPRPYNLTQPHDQRHHCSETVMPGCVK